MLVSMSRSLNLNCQIQFAGFILGKDLPAYNQAVDLFVLPTIEHEGFWLVTLEALASGTPVLGTPVGGTREILGRFDSNYLFRDTTPVALAELITATSRRLAEQPVLYTTLSLRCRRFAEENYSWEKNVKEIEEIFIQNMRIRHR
jgi:glycosyltransferase involved in cell wall biosynthesis